jgi:RHS repeat-associated protein
MIDRSPFTALVFKWFVTLLLMVYLAVPPGGIVVLAAAHSPAGATRTKASKQKLQRKAGGADRSSSVPSAPQNKLGRISLTALDLSRTPTEEELKMAGQLGSPLSPSRPADPAKIADPDERRRQEDDNLLFGQAIQKWNQHNYQEAIKLFRQFRSEHPDSPWAGEAELHVGCAHQFQGSWNEAQSSFEWILWHHEKGSDIYQKAKLRRSVLHVDQGQLDEAIDSFNEMLETESDWGRRTYAQSWIQRISVYEANEIALRDCGAKSVAYVLRQKGGLQKADEASRSPAPGSRGFSLGELAQFARKFGLTPRAVRAGRAQLQHLPVPFIAHYSDQHFVVVTDFGASGSIKLFDPRLDRPTELTGDQFDEQWSGLALVFAAPSKKIKLATTTELAGEMGGCCGSPRYPSDLGPNCDAPPSCGMPAWQVNPVNMNLVVQDVPMWYDSEIGPRIAIEVTYNSQDSLNQLRPFGNKWIFNYASYAMESPGGAPPGSVLIVMPGGRGDLYQPNGQGGYVSPAGIFNSLSKLGAYTFDLQLTDGTVYHYGVPPGMTGYSSLLLSIENRNHNFVTINHDSNGAITGITDAQNRTWALTYNGQGLVSRVDDPFGRSATFSYDAYNNLTGQTDMGGLSYGYSYDANVYLTNVTKPSGTTGFYIEPSGANGGYGGYPPPGAPMWESYRITVTDPLGFKEEYYYNGDTPYGWYRDKNQYLQAGSPPTGNGPKTTYTYALVSGQGVVSQIRYADGRTFTYSNFNAARQPQTITDQNGHATKLTYNSKGRVLTRADARNVLPANQYMTIYTYAANNIDLVKVTDYFHDNAHPALQLTYDGNRNVTSIADGLGRATAMSYNQSGQISTVTDANTQVRAFNYGGSHRFTSITQNGNTLRSIVPDAVGRIGSETNANGYTLSYTYDGLNRPLRMTYPDGSYTGNQWSCCHLDSQRDRAGNVTTFTYDQVNRLTLTTDAENRLTQYVYDPAGNLIQLNDPNWNRTWWQYDNRNRVARKIYADGSSYLYDYDGVGNLLHQTDARGVVTTYGYDVVNNLTSIAAPSLTAIGFTYDSLNRRTHMTDGTGATTFGYDLASQLTTIDGRLANDTISLSYDALGRLTGRSINNAGAATLVYDSYGRPQTATNPLGTFTYNYPDPVSTLLASITATSGPNISFSYLDAAHDQRLGEIWHKDSGNQTISKFDYEYNVLGAITRWTQQTDTNSAQHYNFDYDRVSQLKGATLRDVSDAILKSYSYNYDSAGNRTVEVIDTLVNGETPNNLNQFTNRQGGTGMLPIRGTTDVPGWVFINGNYAPPRPDNSFEGRAAVTPGDNTITVEATDQNGNTTTNRYSVTVTGSGNKTLTYDANGNLVSDGTRTFEWDPMNRLTAVTSGTHRSECTYNGLSQRVKIVEKENGNVTSTKQFVWVPRATQPSEERDGSNNVTKRFYAQGEQMGGTSYYYTRDHLGSVRELTDSTGAVRVRYDYDPYGQRTKLSDSIDADFGFTGFYFHGPSALNFSRTRAYDGDLARWISRDPIAESGGLNLYRYAENSPAIYTDPSGELLPALLLAAAILFALDRYANAPGPCDRTYTGSAPNALPALLGLAGAAGAISDLLDGAIGSAVEGIANPVPSALARVIPGEGPFPTLGLRGSADVFVTDAAVIRGMTPAQISETLGIPASDTFTVIEFPTPSQGLASPIFRCNPGFVGRGLTSGGAPEFVVPNGPIPPGATTTIIGSP